MEPKILFFKLVEVNFIVREDDKWTLTAKGKLAGGKIKTSVKLGDYIEWPEGFNLEKLPDHQTPDTQIEMKTSTKLGKELGVSAIKLNHVFAELGWVYRSMRGWVATERGLSQGAEQNEDSRSGIPYVKWPITITQTQFLLNSIAAVKPSNMLTKDETNSHSDKHQAIDGHNLDSIAEMLIDNWLYMAEIPHAYKRRLPIEEEVHCCFYIPTGKVYIEYSPAYTDAKDQARKDKKLAIYQKYGFNLIELNEQDIANLDEILARLLLKFGVLAY
ncbi:glycerol kinase [Paraglaciecola aquimarina]|uniref:Glycerol kinase n=1 Tax=Paraglaciecola algarum TaxID=3050085 RepID=A0ABS9D4J5_9ALTE|nr:glycerol kinase [Paraglaciecola sp. G1-23]MCF2947851.1 glycerol kinase [Paraglaciecola sp. G1-23]